MAATDPFLSRVVATVRDFAMDTYDEVRWPVAKLYPLVDSANADIFEQISREVEPRTNNRFAESDFTIVAGQEDYPWPGNFRKFIRLVYKDSNGYPTREILPTQYLSDLPGIILFDKLRGFRLSPKPTVGETGWTLVYEAGVCPILSYGTAKAATSTTITLDSTPTAGYTVAQTNFYNNSIIRIVSGAGAGELRRVTAFTDALSATVTPAWTVTPTSSSVYEILPCVEYPDDEAIAWQIVMRMKAADSDQKGYEYAKEQYENCMRRIFSKVGNVQDRQGPALGDSFVDPFDYGDLSL